MSLIDELEDHIVEDDQALSSRLGLDSVPSELVDDCYRNLLIDKKVGIMRLREVVDQAGDEEEYYCMVDDEDQMHGYLVDIFNYIVSFGRSPPQRQWDASETEIIETGLDSVPCTYPKLRLGPRNLQPIVSWRDLASFAVATPGGTETPLKTSRTLIQSGEYARLHLAGSPFRLFSVCLMITGNNFQVGAFDRAGVVVSSAANMWTDTKTLIRVIRRLSCDLSHIDMGCDPSVCHLPLHSPWYTPIREIATSLSVPPDSFDYPSYIVQCRKRISMVDGLRRGGRHWETCEWLTIGPPVWTSLSLLGQGTSIWRVTPVVGDVINVHAKVYMLKNEWRDSQSVSDSEIYEMGQLEEGAAGATDFHYGGDAVFPYAKSSPAISITNIRNPDYHVNRSNLLDAPSHRSINSTPMLHRLILKTVGRPLWDAVDYIDLLKGFRAALIAHERLWEQGILHRGISAGNILLAAEAAEEGKEGFITDLEFARLRQIRQTRRRANDDGTEATATTWTDPARGLLMTGTVLFMAIEKLKAVQGTSGVPGVADQVHYDLESFIWVFAYTIMRRLMAQKQLDSSSTSLVNDWFKDCFCSLSIKTIVSNRAALTPLELPCPIGDDILPPPIKDLLTQLSEMVRYNQPADRYAELAKKGRKIFVFVRLLTHQLLIEAIDFTISELQSLGR